MPWEGVTVGEQRENFIRDFELSYYSISELAERFNISRKTAYKWIYRYREKGKQGLHDVSRKPKSSPSKTPEYIEGAIIKARRKHPSWGPRKLLNILGSVNPSWELPAVSTAAHILKKHGLVYRRRRIRRAHPGCPLHLAMQPNEIWATDYKGQFRLQDGSYCFPITISDLYSRYLLGCEVHPCISIDHTHHYFLKLFREYGLPDHIRTDNGVLFASNALARLSKLSVWWIKLGIYPELIEPGKPQQNGIHERMHRTMKQEATVPPSWNAIAQQRRFNRFRREFNEDRPHEAIGMRRPNELYRNSSKLLPRELKPYDYPEHYLVRRVSRCGAVRYSNDNSSSLRL